jgi:DNA-directed RNA polymerase
MPTYKIDKIKISRSFMPNFIHSLDASNVHLLFKFFICRIWNYNICLYSTRLFRKYNE